ncbi:hypothetical protein ABIF64_006854 [Bradyrhizobium japonicum]|uniref:hypothetical protein n=1 Tax=Bradyrhizobium japonicum TaxID=375 RepID=UPI0033929C5C
MKQTRAQRRQMQKIAERVDRVTQADRLFFERRPDRRHRVRLASQAELEQCELMEGRPTSPPPGCRVFTIVRNIAPGARLRLYTYGLEDAETDLSEAVALAIYEAAATPKTMAIEAQMRAAVEART